jgi:hypothetical protein
MLQAHKRIIILKRMLLAGVLCGLMGCTAWGGRTETLVTPVRLTQPASTLLATTRIPSAAAAVTAAAGPQPTMTPALNSHLPVLDKNCWKTLLSRDNFREYGAPFAIREGQKGEIYILYGYGLVRFFKDQVFEFDFEVLFQCEVCHSFGKIAVLPNGDVWVSHSEGLFHIQGDTIEFVPFEKVFPNHVVVGNHIKVLTSTPSGVLWVSDNDGHVCQNNKRWICYQPLVKKDGIPDSALSAVAIGEDHIWFGSYRGKIVEYENGVWKLYDLPKMFPQYPGWKEIGSMAYDKNTGLLWGVNTGGSSCRMDGKRNPEIGVFSKTKEGKWTIYSYDLFDLFTDDDCLGRLGTITIDANSRVWLTMGNRYGVVSFDGKDWKTLSGKILPAGQLIDREQERKNHMDEKCQLDEDEYIVDIYGPARGGLLMLSNFGSYQYIGKP